MDALLLNTPGTGKGLCRETLFEEGDAISKVRLEEGGRYLPTGHGSGKSVQGRAPGRSQTWGEQCASRCDELDGAFVCDALQRS